MTRRTLLGLLFAAVAVTATGCCNTPIRNLVYRIRHCHGCTPGYADGPVATPAYAPPIADYGPQPGCSSCASAAPIYGPTAPPAGYPVYSGPPVPVAPGMIGAK